MDGLVSELCLKNFSDIKVGELVRVPFGHCMVLGILVRQLKPQNPGMILVLKNDKNIDELLLVNLIGGGSLSKAVSFGSTCSVCVKISPSTDMASIHNEASGLPGVLVINDEGKKFIRAPASQLGQDRYVNIDTWEICSEDVAIPNRHGSWFAVLDWDICLSSQVDQEKGAVSLFSHRSSSSV